MKRLFCFFAFAFAFTTAFAAEEESEEDPFYPFSVIATYVGVDKADFRSSSFGGQHIRYHQTDIAFTYIHPFTPYCGMLFGAAYVGTGVDWKENPDFNETDFGYVNFSVGGFTRSFPQWVWTATAGIFIDTEEFDLSDYSIYQGVLQGKYELNDWVIFDLGFILELGLNKEKIWPILGFELFPCDSWKLSAVYPANIRFEYFLHPKITTAAYIRFLRNRHRVASDEPLPKGIFEYQNWGAELELIYRPLKCISFKGFGGSTFGGGDLKVTDRKDHNARHYKFNGSFYGGATAAWTF